jgi:hypothetical protein
VVLDFLERCEREAEEDEHLIVIFKIFKSYGESLICSFYYYFVFLYLLYIKYMFVNISLDFRIDKWIFF